MTYYMASKYEPKWSTQFEYNLLGNEFVVSDPMRAQFQPVMVYLRGMEKTGTDTKYKGGTNNHYLISVLSDGIKCATQGCKFRCDMTIFALFD